MGRSRKMRRIYQRRELGAELGAELEMEMGEEAGRVGYGVQ